MNSLRGCEDRRSLGRQVRSLTGEYDSHRTLILMDCGSRWAKVDGRCNRQEGIPAIFLNGKDQRSSANLRVRDRTQETS